VCAVAGYQVLLVDVSDAALERGVATLGKNLERQVSKAPWMRTRPRRRKPASAPAPTTPSSAVRSW
jgi:3-hydroxyacyl-CoA dehydrogenase